MSAEVAVKLGTTIAVQLAKASLRKVRSWQRLVANDVAKSVDFKFSKRRLRRLLSRSDGTALLTPGTEAEAAESVESIFVALRGSRDWRGLSEEVGRARSFQLLTSAQEKLLRRLDPSSAVDVAERRSLSRDSQTHQKLDDIATVFDSGNRLTDLCMHIAPPVAEMIRDSVAGAPRVAEIARVLVDSAQPGDALAAWVDDPPRWLAEGAAANWTIVGEALASYKRTDAAVRALLRAVDEGIAERSHWRARAATMLFDENPDEARRILDDSATDPLSRTVRHLLREEWEAARDAVGDWRPERSSEKDLRAALAATAAIRAGLDDEAFSWLEERVGETQSAGILLALARLLSRRAQLGLATSRDAELERAVTLATRARDSRRQWRGDSVEGIAVAADALALLHDWAGIWALVRTPPDGHATAEEAQDPRALSKAALAAASTGRGEVARQLAEKAGTFEAAWIQAALAESETDDSGEPVVGSAEVLRKWEAALAAATDDMDRLLAARGVLLAGGNVSEIDELRARYPDAIRQSEQLAAAYRATPGLPRAQILARLRALRAENVHAAIRLVELLQQDAKPDEAAIVLREAADRFDDQHLRLMAASVLADAGRLREAAADASEALRRGGPGWRGTARARRIMLQFAAEAGDWDEVVAQSRLLIADQPGDDEARWALAFALDAQDRSAEAWSVLRPGGMLLAAPNAQRAALRLRLIGRHGSAGQLVRESVQALRAYGDEEQFAAFALMLVFTGNSAANEHREDAEASDVDAETLAELHSEAEEFFRRFPDSRLLRRISFESPQELLDNMADLLRNRAAAGQRFYRDVAEGHLPTGFLSSISGRSYASAFLLRAAGGLRVQSPDPGEAQTDRLTALRFVDNATKRLVADASALHVAALLPSAIRESVLGSTLTLAVTDRTLLDLRLTRDEMSIRSRTTSTYDLAADRLVFIEDSEEEVAERVARAERMVAMATSSFAVLSTRHVTTEVRDEPEAGPWLGVVEECRRERFFLWSDDVALRRLARSEGVETFGTLDWLAALKSAGLVPPEFLEEAELVLSRAYAVDLPPNLARLRLVAEQDEWRARASAYFLARPASWRDNTSCVALLREAYAKNVSRPDELEAWVNAAAFGRAAASATDEGAIESTVNLVAGLGLEKLTTPVTMRRILEGARAGCRERIPGADPWAKAVTSMHHTLLRVYGEQVAAELLLRLTQGLDEADRLAAVQTIVTRKR